MQRNRVMTAYTELSIRSNHEPGTVGGSTTGLHIALLTWHGRFPESRSTGLDEQWLQLSSTKSIFATMAVTAPATRKPFGPSLLSPPAAYPTPGPPDLDQESLSKLDQIKQHFSRQGFELPDNNESSNEGTKSGLSEREMMFLVSRVHAATVPRRAHGLHDPRPLRPPSSPPVSRDFHAVSRF